LKKFWACFLVLATLFSPFSTFISVPTVKAKEAVTVTTVKYLPKTVIVSAQDAQSPLTWNQPLNALNADLSSSTLSFLFDQTNSAVLSLNGSSTALTADNQDGGPSQSPEGTSSSSGPNTASADAADSSSADPDQPTQSTQTTLPHVVDFTLPFAEPKPKPEPEQEPAPETAPKPEVTVSDEMTAQAAEVEMVTDLSPVADTANQSSQDQSTVSESSQDPTSDQTTPSADQTTNATDQSSPDSSTSGQTSNTSDPSSDQATEQTTPPGDETDSNADQDATQDGSTDQDAAQDTDTTNDQTDSNQTTDNPDTNNTDNDSFSSSNSPASDPSQSNNDQQPSSSAFPLAPKLEYRKFLWDEANPEIPTSSSLSYITLNLSLSASAVPGAKLSLEYSVPSSTWMSLGVISLDSAQSNASNGGYYSFILPKELSGKLGELNIRLSYLGPDSLSQSLPNDLVYLDGLWVEEAYESFSSDEDLSDFEFATSTPETFMRLDYLNGLFKTHLPGSLSDPITLSSDGGNGEESISFQMFLVGVNASSVPERIDDKAIYPDAFPSTDLEYQLNDKGLKENIILKDPNHPNRFRYLLNLDQYDYKQVSPNRIDLFKKGKKGNDLYRLYSISAPIMTDSEGNTSDGLTFKLSQNVLTLVPDKEWLSTATYPVTIDPIIEIMVLNVHSHPVEGTDWNVDFTTTGTADLTITPADEDTINDLEYTSLTCGTEDRTAQTSFDKDTHVISYKDWSCDYIASVSHKVLRSGKHHLVFTFSSATETATSEAFNSTYVWDGGGGDANWSTPQNWSTDIVPGSSDLAVFDNSCVTNCNPTISATTSVGGIFIATTSTVTITQAAGAALTIGSLNYYQAGGTFTGGNAALDINGSFTLTGGTFTPTAGTFTIAKNTTLSGGTFNGTGANLKIDGGSNYNTLLSCSGDFNTMTGLSSVTIDKTAFTSGAFTLGSGCTLNANMISDNAGLITIDGIFSTTGDWLSDEFVNNGTTTVIGTSFVVENYLINNGFLSLPNATTFDINGDFTNATSGTVSYAGTDINVSQDWVQNGTFDITGKTLNFDGGSSQATTLNCSGDFNATTGVGAVNITKTSDSGTSFTLGSGCTLTADVNSATLITVSTGSTLITTGNWASRSVNNNGTITVSGTSFVVGNYLINNGFLSLPNATTFDINGDFTNATSGVISYLGSTVTVEKSWINNGDFDTTGKMVNMDGDESGIFYCPSSGIQKGNLINSKLFSYTVTFSGDCTITGSYTRSDGIIANPASATVIAVQGDFSVSTADAFGGSNLSFVLSGSNNQVLTYNGPALTMPITINKPSGTVSLGANFSTATGSTLTLTSGTFTPGIYNATFADAVTLNGGTYLASSSVSTFNSGLTVSGGAFQGGTGAIDINGNLTISSGTTTLAGNLTLSGDLSNTGGSFSASAGTVTLDGTDQSITGSNTFYNLTKAASATSTLTFAAGDTQTILNALTLTGVSGGLLLLRSSSDGTQWRIDPQGTRTISYLDVKDSNNANTSPIDAVGTNSVDSNNNTNWQFAIPNFTQADYQWFQNIDDVQPVSSISLQNNTATITTTSSPVRLRMNVSVDASMLANYQSFRLQVSTSTLSGWHDILPRSNPAWWNDSWQNRRKITFNNASSSENLIDFPVLVSLTSSNIDYSKTQDTGADIRFVDADGTTELNYEIEKWDETATSTVWVKVPQIDASSTSDYIWMYYNNPSAASTATTTGVWDSNFKTIYHLKEGSGVILYDSTSNGINATKIAETRPNATTTARAGGAQSFNSVTSDYATIISRPVQDDFTISYWVKTTQTGGTGNWYNCTGLVDGEVGGYVSDYGTTLCGSKFGFGTGNPDNTLNSISNINNGEWHYVTATRVRSTGAKKIYIDGILDNSNIAGTASLTSPPDLRIGGIRTGGGYYNGILDEIRLSNVARSSSWIQAEYLTESDQYNSYDSEETIGDKYWRFYNNPTVATSANISSLLLGSSNVFGTYNEANPTAVNPFSASAGQYIEYDFSLDPSGILANTNYYFRLVKSDGTALDSYSNYPSLIWSVATATIATDPATSVANTTATLNGTISDLGDASSTSSYGFVYAISSGPTVDTNLGKADLGSTSTIGSFTYALTNLSVSTTYYVKAYAITVAGTVYGDEITFTTGGNPTFTQADFQFFQNSDAIQPGASLGNLSATTTIHTTSSPVRLRMNIQVPQGLDPATQAFKLQVSTSTAEGWVTINTAYGAGNGWWNDSWQNRRKITFNNASSSENLIDFPVLVSLTSSNIDYSKTQDTGADIRFVDADGTTELNYEIEKWDETATSTVWVKVPQIDASSTSDYIWMYYNNPSAASTATTTGVWDGNYMGVWHLSTSGLLSDSTLNANNGINHSAAATTGQIDGAGNFASGARIDIGNNPSIRNISTIFTLETWFNTTASQGSYYARLINKYQHPTSGYDINMGGPCSNCLVFEFWDTSSVWHGVSTVGGGYNDGKWHRVAGVYDGQNMLIYVDGILNNSNAVVGFTVKPNDVIASIGASTVETQPFTGKVDEARISSIARSSSWIQAEYLTESDQYNSYGSEETVGDMYWKFYDNLSVSTSTNLSTLLLGSSTLQGSYSESNPTALNPFAASTGDFIEYDFSLDPSGILANTNYYFRLVKSDGTALDSYSNYPTLIMIPNQDPDTPSSLGPSSLVDGSWVTDNTPSFTFTLSDPDISDMVKYNIQISTTSDFSSLAVDYVSALSAQGAVSYTPDTALPDASAYYWRVATIDSNNATSSYAVANFGNIAFRLDSIAPTPGIVSVESVSTTTVTITLSGASDFGSGLSSTPFVFTNVTDSSSSSATTSTEYVFSGLTSGTLYTFKVTVTDAAGNTAETALVSTTTISTELPPSGGGGGGGTTPTTTPPTEPPVLTCPSPAINAFTGCYYDNMDFTGLKATATVPAVDFDWSNSSPFPGIIDPDTFSATWEGYFSFNKGNYRFTAHSDDGVRVYVDGQLVTENWTDHSATTVKGDIALSAGEHLVKVEYYENGGQAVAKLSWREVPQDKLKCPKPGKGEFSGCYYEGKDFSDLLFTRTDPVIDFNWGNSSPDSVLPADNFSVVWEGTFDFEAGNYNFITTADDGVRLYVDDQLLINQWKNQAATTYTAAKTLSSGKHSIKMEYYEEGGQAVARLSWTKLLPIVSCPGPAYNVFTVCYYDNIDFTNLVATSTVSAIDFNWGNSSPSPSVQPDTFSARWQGNFDFTTGTYEFTATADDGVRLYLDGRLLIDQWKDQSAATYKATTTVSSGSHLLRMDYYENGGQASSRLSWRKLPQKPIFSTIGSLAFSNVSTSSVSVIFLKDPQFDVSLPSAPYVFSNLTTSQQLSARSVNFATFTGLSPNTLYTFSLIVTDTDGYTYTTLPATATTLPLSPEIIIPTTTPTTTPDVVVIPPPPAEPEPEIPTPPTAGNEEPKGPGVGETITDTFNDIVDGAGNAVGSIISGTGNIASSTLTVITGLAYDTLTGAQRSVAIVSQGVGKAGEKTKDIAVNTVIALKDSKVSAQTTAGIGAAAVAPTAIAIQYSVATQGLLLNIASLSDLWLHLLQFFYGLLTTLGIRSRRRRWGTVYDSKTKQPLDPVIVELVDAATGKTVDQSITDLYGRFGFFDRPGKYFIRAKKTHYSFPSKDILGSQDGIYGNLYHGEMIEVLKGGVVLTPNIPMDPEEFDWNQQDKQRLVKVHPKLEAAIHLFMQFLFWGGAVGVLLLFIAQTNLVNGLACLLYLFLAVLRKVVLRVRLWGRIQSESRNVQGLYLELSPVRLPTIVIGKAMTDQSGKFFLKAQPGEYIFRVKEITASSGSTLATNLVCEQPVVVEKDGVVNKIINI